MTGGIFISYRRDDTAAFARLIRDRLKSQFDEKYLFLDVDNIRAGLEYREILSERLGDCDALIAIVGKSWADCRDEKGDRRLDNPKDFVRMEIEAALKRNVKNVFPVLVDGTPMPKAEQLPASLEKFAHLENIEISHRYFDDDVKTRLVPQLEFVKEKIRQRAEHEAQRLADEEAQRKAETDARRLADEEARRQAEAEALLKEQEARRRVEEETRRLAEEEARRQAEAEWRQKAVEEARQAMEMETRREAEARADHEANQRQVEQEAKWQAAAGILKAMPAGWSQLWASLKTKIGKEGLSLKKEGLGLKVAIGIVGALVGGIITGGSILGWPVGAVLALLAYDALSKRRQAGALNTGRAGSEASSPKPPKKLLWAGLISLLLLFGLYYRSVPIDLNPINASDQFNLGRRYDTGKGVAQDFAQAMLWYRKAADQGNAKAQYSLGSLYENGSGVARNVATARAWYTKSAAQGNSDAQAELDLLGKK